MDEIERALSTALPALGNPDLRKAFLAALAASGYVVVRQDPSVRMVESGEDVLAEIVKNPPAFGVRCGCDDCDQAAWDAVKQVWAAMLAASRSEKETNHG